MRYFLYLNSKNGKLEVSFDGSHGKQHTTLSSAEEYNAFFANEAARLGVDPSEFAIQASSSLDFPEEYTDKPETLALVEAINA